MASEKSPAEPYSKFGSPHSGEMVELRDSSRSNLFFRVILFQFKLFADGIRDIALSPLSILAGLLGLMFSHSDPHYYFNRLLRLGHRSDRWINLFDNYSSKTSSAKYSTMDDLAEKLEATLRNDYESNGMTAKTVRKLEKIIAEMKYRRRQN